MLSQQHWQGRAADLLGLLLYRAVPNMCHFVLCAMSEQERYAAGLEHDRLQLQLFLATRVRWEGGEASMRDEIECTQHTFPIQVFSHSLYEGFPETGGQCRGRFVPGTDYKLPQHAQPVSTTINFARDKVPVLAD